MKSTASLIILSILMAGCSKHQTPITKRTQMTLLSKKEELSVGEKEYKQIMRTCKVSKDEDKICAVERVGKKLVDNLSQHKYKWKFSVVENDSINAVCLPGGKIILNTGLFKVAKNDDQLAAIIAHEMAHAISRHGNARISRAKVLNATEGAGAVISALINPLLIIPFIITYEGITQEVIINPHSRMEEHEADIIGLNLMYKAGYNIDESLELWKNMKEVNVKKAKHKSSTHASYDERMHQLEKAIKEIKKKRSINL